AAGRCAESTSTVCTGGPDGAPDGNPGTIRITVRDDRGVLAPGVRVLVADPTGIPVADTSTSTNGVAMVEVPGVVDVTVIQMPTGPARLSTILGVAPGDDLLFGPDRNELASVVHDITWPSNTDALQYQVMS